MNLIGSSPLSTAGRMATDAAAAEPWRAVTALTLHADSEHLMANGFGLVLFAVLLSRRVGLGVTLLVAVAGGALGNLLDAFVLAPSRPWLGASTAVFALLGAMAAAYRSALMAVLGVALVWASHAADINTGAHAAGLVAGLVLGLMLRSDDDEPAGVPAQLGALALSAGAVAGCWFLALGGVL